LFTSGGLGLGLKNLVLFTSLFEILTRLLSRLSRLGITKLMMSLLLLLLRKLQIDEVGVAELRPPVNQRRQTPPVVEYRSRGRPIGGELRAMTSPRAGRHVRAAACKYLQNTRDAVIRRLRGLALAKRCLNSETKVSESVNFPTDF